MNFNRWGEPTGLDVPERGDYVQVRKGTTTGYVIGVKTRLFQVVDVHFVMDGPCFLETRDPKELRIVKKGVR